MNSSKLMPVSSVMSGLYYERLQPLCRKHYIERTGIEPFDIDIVEVSPMLVTYSAIGKIVETMEASFDYFV